MFDYHYFTDFLNKNPGLSSKVLADRLKELERSGFIQRRQISRSEVQYHLTVRGVKLKRVLYALSMFGAEEFPTEVFGNVEGSYHDMVNLFGRSFGLDKSELDMYHTPLIEQAYTRDTEIGSSID
jgi:DNA-binding Lrp family transcriptional regulator